MLRPRFSTSKSMLATCPRSFKFCPCCSMAGHPLGRQPLPEVSCCHCTTTSYKMTLLITILQHRKPHGKPAHLNAILSSCQSFICSLQVECCSCLWYSTVGLSSRPFQCAQSSLWGTQGKAPQPSGPQAPRKGCVSITDRVKSCI